MVPVAGLTCLPSTDKQLFPATNNIIRDVQVLQVQVRAYVGAGSSVSAGWAVAGSSGASSGSSSSSNSTIDAGEVIRR
jgi:hypothetical protein